MLQIVHNHSDLTAAATCPTGPHKSTVRTRATIKATARTMETSRATARILRATRVIRGVDTANRVLKDSDRAETRIRATAINRTDVGATAVKVRGITIKIKEILKVIIPTGKVNKDKVSTIIVKGIIRDRTPGTRVVRAIRDPRGVKRFSGVNIKFKINLKEGRGA